jgi:hypothetical protein
MIPRARLQLVSTWPGKTCGGCGFDLSGPLSGHDRPRQNRADIRNAHKGLRPHRHDTSIGSLRAPLELLKDPRWYSHFGRRSTLLYARVRRWASWRVLLGEWMTAGRRLPS